jgi:hypothetical protein
MTRALMGYLLTKDGSADLIAWEKVVVSLPIHIGTTRFAEYAGEPTWEIRCAMPVTARSG